VHCRWISVLRVGKNTNLVMVRCSRASQSHVYAQRVCRCCAVGLAIIKEPCVRLERVGQCYTVRLAQTMSTLRNRSVRHSKVGSNRRIIWIKPCVRLKSGSVLHSRVGSNHGHAQRVRRCCAVGLAIIIEPCARLERVGRCYTVPTP
jgi:hypothetical protein